MFSNSSTFKRLIIVNNDIVEIESNDIEVERVISRLYNVTYFNNEHLQAKVISPHFKIYFLRTKNIPSSFSPIKFSSRLDLLYYKLNKNTFKLVSTRFNVKILPSLVKIAILVLQAKRRNSLLLHCAVVKYKDRIIVIPGEPGRGKSTTSLLLSKLGATILCDDYALLDKSFSCNPLLFLLLYEKSEKYSYASDYLILKRSFESNFFFKNPKELSSTILHILKQYPVVRMRKNGIAQNFKDLRSLLSLPYKKRSDFILLC